MKGCSLRCARLGRIVLQSSGTSGLIEGSLVCVGCLSTNASWKSETCVRPLKRSETRRCHHKQGDKAVSIRRASYHWCREVAPTCQGLRTQYLPHMAMYLLTAPGESQQRLSDADARRDVLNSASRLAGKRKKRPGARMKITNTSATKLGGSNRRYSDIDKIK